MSNCSGNTNTNIDPCGCQEPEVCGCKETIDLGCTFYGGETTLIPLNIPPGMDGNTVVKVINDFIKDFIAGFEPDPLFLKNIGTGKVLYKGLSPQYKHEFKSFLEGTGIEVTEQQDTLTFSIDEDWLEEHLPDIDYPVIESIDLGTGTSLRADLSNKKIPIKTIESDDFIISDVVGGGIKINNPGGGSSSNDLYLDVNFIRPSNWDEKAESIDGLKTAKGTLNDPFKDFDEYLRRVVGEIGGSNVNGPYSRVNPKLSKTLQVLSTFETNKFLEVNNNVLYFKNNSLAIYIGDQEYGYNTERLWDAMPKTGGVLNRPIRCEIKGEGGILNKYHFGAVCHKTSVASTSNTVSCLLSFTATESGLKFYELSDSGTYTALTEADNVTPYLYGGAQAYGSTQAPTTPIIKIIGKNAINWGATMDGTKISIISNTQSFIEVSSTASLTCNLDSLIYLVNARYIGYQKKLYPGLVGMTSDEIEILGSKSLYFKPYSNRNIFEIEDESMIAITNLSTAIDQKLEVGVNSILKISGESAFTIRSSFKELGGGTAISFIESLGTGNYIEINNYEQTSKNTYFVKGDNVNPVSIKFVNSNNNNVEIIKKNVTTLNIDTLGTFSSIQSKPINSGIENYTNNSDAITIGKLIPSMLYYNTTNNGIDKVI